MGDAFVHVSLTKAQSLLEKEAEAVDRQISELKDQAEECEKVMGDLKIVLYGKFGKSINLDL